MSDETELQINDTWSEDEGPKNPRRRRADSGDGKPLRIALVVILILVFIGGIYYFLTKQSTGGQPSPVEAKLSALDEKVAGLERQLADLQGKPGSPAVPDDALLKKVDVLAQRIENLEREKQPAVQPKVKPVVSSKPNSTTPKQVHTVQKGENLQSISKKYGIPADRLRKLNNLQAGQSLRVGQKIVLSTGH